MSHTTSIVELLGSVTGMLEGGSVKFRSVVRNSTGVRETRELTIGSGISNATTIANPVDAKMMVIAVGDTNTAAYRISGTTSEVGIPCSSAGFIAVSIPPSTAANTYHVYTTSTRAITGARLMFF